MDRQEGGRGGAVREGELERKVEREMREKGRERQTDRQEGGRGGAVREGEKGREGQE